MSGRILRAALLGALIMLLLSALIGWMRVDAAPTDSAPAPSQLQAVRTGR